MNAETSRNDGDGSYAPTNQDAGLVLAIDGAEAWLLRRRGYKCVTSAKLRAFVVKTLKAGCPERAVEAIRRFTGVSEADSPKRWPLWKQSDIQGLEGASDVRQALDDLPEITTPLTDPDEPVILKPTQLWNCRGTTVLVASDTFELVRVADTYAGFDCYRPHGRMDEPFTPAAGRVCLITKDELRLIRLEDIDNPTIVFCYKPEEGEKTTGMEVTPQLFWPTSLRALCGEFGDLTIGVATVKVAGRHGYPFFLGLTRGLAFESETETSASGAAALEYCIQTNRAPETVRLNVVVWEGGDDVRKLACYGGLSVFLNKGGRRKVQLRSLGLVRSGTVAGAHIYDMGSNYNTLLNWAVRRTFERPEASMRNRNLRRVRLCNKTSPEYRRGEYIYNMSPSGIRVRPKNPWQASSCLRNLVVVSGESSGVTTVPLKTLRAGETYYLNGRPKIKADGAVFVDPKRWKIRCAVFNPKEGDAMLEWLATEPHVLLAGKTDKEKVFAVVRVANGTEDQQTEAFTRWAQDAGRQFVNACGCMSVQISSYEADLSIAVADLKHANWNATALETACFEPYQTAGDYAKPLEIKRRSPASASERARAYADKVQGLDEEGRRNTMLSSALLNIVEKFGKAALEAVAPELMARSTLPEKQKRKMFSRIRSKKG